MSYRLLFLASGVLVFSAAVMAALAILSGSSSLGLFALFAGILGGIGGAAAGLMLMRHQQQLFYQVITRTKNLEVREHAAAKHLAELSEVSVTLRKQGSTIEEAQRGFGGRLAELQKDSSAKWQRLDGTIAGLQNSSAQSRRALKSFDSSRHALQRRLADFDQVISKQLHPEVARQGNALALQAQTIDQHRSSLEQHETGLAAQSQELAAHASQLAAHDESVRRVGAWRESAQKRMDAVRRDVRTLRGRVPGGVLEELRDSLAAERIAREALEENAYALALNSEVPLGDIFAQDDVDRLLERRLSSGDLLDALPIIRAFPVLDNLSLTTLRSVYKELRATGYWRDAVEILEVIARKGEREGDLQALRKVRGEISTYENPLQFIGDAGSENVYDSAGPILHLVGHALPRTQTGYTLRTQYTVQSIKDMGLPVAVVVLAETDQGEDAQGRSYDVDGVDYYVLPGISRRDVPMDEWVQTNVEALSDVVRTLRPSILHAHSDFLHAAIGISVGEMHGVPVVYETRGFWEESWLSRVVDVHHSSNPERLFRRIGMPDAYTLRKKAEESVRARSRHVYTLAEVMKKHILASDDSGQIAPDDVSVVPNAVDVEAFPVLDTDAGIKAELGIQFEALVVGYISSMVEYEGIDTLIRAFARVQKKKEAALHLVLVGDGLQREKLEQLSRRLDVPNVHFVGRIPHEQVLRYYSIIDIFVVPRKSTRVSELVTPLKPFEAFSTGRAVIMSDVAALGEIAEQSDAVALFAASDTASLTREILRLADDPELREALATKAAAWVRRERTWSLNGPAYFAGYKRLGYTGPVHLTTHAAVSLSDDGIDPQDALKQLASAPVPALVGGLSDGTSQSAEGLWNGGWEYSPFPPVMIQQIQDWTKYGQQHRSWGFRLHAWDFMDVLISEFDLTGDEDWLTRALDIADQWLQYVDTATEEQLEQGMVWYDMSLSLRTPRLIALTVRAARSERIASRALPLLVALRRHLRMLFREESFSGTSNHGFYTAIAQLFAARHVSWLPEASQTLAQGASRLETVAATQFGIDGVHREHSPDYHWMLLTSFERAMQEGFIWGNGIWGNEVADRVAKAAYVLGWMVQPNGEIVQFGDSPARRLAGVGHPSTDGQALFILSEGAEGEAPSRELEIFEPGGLAFVRSPLPTGRESLQAAGYLAFSAAFHSRTHKHADDLNVVLYDCGREILIDSGKYGYGELLAADDPKRDDGFFYGARERQYVESSQAHNVLTLDSRDHQRRNRTPYGSGILEGEQRGRVFDITGRVVHEDFTHRRRLVYRPGVELRLVDSVFSTNEDLREGHIWFNFPAEFKPLRRDGQVIYLESSVDGFQIELTVNGAQTRFLEPQRGSTEPFRGWRSRNDNVLEPAMSLAVSFSVETRAKIETVLRMLPR